MSDRGIITDKNKWIEFFHLFNIGFIEEDNRLMVEMGNTNVIGHCGFYFDVNFENGRFKNIGVWE